MRTKQQVTDMYYRLNESITEIHQHLWDQLPWDDSDDWEDYGALDVAYDVQYHRFVASIISDVVFCGENPESSSISITFDWNKNEVAIQMEPLAINTINLKHEQMITHIYNGVKNTTFDRWEKEILCEDDRDLYAELKEYHMEKQKGA